MPLHNYRCIACKKVFEHLWFIGDTEDGKQPNKVTCEDQECNNVALPSGGELFARTVGRWGDSLSYYDRGLGCEIKSPAHRDQVMAQKGVVPVSQQELDDHTHRKITEHNEHERQVAEFDAHLKSGMHMTDAIDKTFKLNHTTKLNTEISDA